jgi:hypothetical protein
MIYKKRTQKAYLEYSHDTMIAFKPSPTRKKPTDVSDEYDVSYKTTDDVIHEDEKDTQQEYIHSGPTMDVMVKTDCDLAGQLETRQTTTSLMVWVSGALVHWRAHTERIIIPSTAAGKYVVLSKGNTTTKFIREVLKFYGNNYINYFILTDNQAAEHIATQPTMNEHSRSIDTRHHAIGQDYVDGEMRIGGVASPDNESDILTKYLQPPLHQKHTKQLHITQSTLQNCVLTSYHGRTNDKEQATPHRCVATTQQLPLYPAQQQHSPRRNMIAHANAHKDGTEIIPRVPEVLEEHSIDHFRWRSCRQPGERRIRSRQEVFHHQHLLSRGPSKHARHDIPK